MKIASLAKARIKRLFLDVVLKISEPSVEPARSLEREIYEQQEAKVLSLDGLRVRSLFLIVPCNV
jgi:hypothetical protein